MKKDIKYKVRLLLEDYPRSRDDDLFLWMLYLNSYENIEWDFLEKILYVLKHRTHIETITRRRRELQAEFDHLRPSDLCERRRIKFQGELIEDLKREQTFNKEIAEQNYHLKAIKQERLV